MNSLNLNNSLSFSYSFIKRDKELSDLIFESERSIISKKKKINENEKIEDLVPIFFKSYFAIKEGIDQKGIFEMYKASEKRKIITNFSLYKASDGVKHFLYDTQIENNWRVKRINPLIKSSVINQESEHSIFRDILIRIKNLPYNRNYDLTKFGYFQIFENINEISSQNLNDLITKKDKIIIENLEVIKNELDYSHLQKPIKPKEKLKIKVSKEKEKVIIPNYNINPKAHINKIIGNEEVIEELRSAFIRVCAFDKQKESNPFSYNGYSFKDAFLLLGEPGVGKNYTVDALCNYYNQHELLKNKKIHFTDIGNGIKDTYKDGSTIKFTKFIEEIRNSNDIYINIFDEADGIFPTNQYGKLEPEAQKILRDLKTVINQNSKGNSLYIFMTNHPKEFESALIDRFIPLQVKGPKTQLDFAKLLKQELGRFNYNPNSNQMISDDDLFKLGTEIYNKKRKYAKKEKSEEKINYDNSDYIPISGRFAANIVKPFIEGDNKKIIQNEELIFKSSFNEVYNQIPLMNKQITMESLEKSLKNELNRRLCVNQEYV
jgi:SpoVK/Ycf46/Vps4 family AAA+-type ATPase